MNHFQFNRGAMVPSRLVCLIAVLMISAVIAPIPVLAASASSGLDTPSGVSTLPFSVEGTQIMNLTSTGLGIGTTSPSSQLEVDGSQVAVIGRSSASNGVEGLANTTGIGVYGESKGGIGVYGSATASWAGEFAGTPYGVAAIGTTWAGYFIGPIYAGTNITFSDGSVQTKAVRAAIAVYQCPFDGGCQDGQDQSGGVWASYGCQGQVSSQSICQNAWYANGMRACNNNCSYLGTLAVE
jgi:hypothetical protein